MKNEEKDDILKDVRKYIYEQKRLLAYNIYQKCKGNIEAINIGADSLGITTKEFLENVRDHIAANSDLPSYARVFKTLDTLTSDEEVIKYLKVVNLPINYLYSKIQSYIIDFRPDIAYRVKYPLKSILRRKLLIYEVYLDNEKKKKSNKSDNNYIKQATDVITSFINSSYSLERFRFTNDIKIPIFQNFLETVKNTNYNLYQNCIEVIELKENIKTNELEQEVYFILDLIKELGDDFTSIDFFTNTSYGIRELVKKADEMLENGQLKKTDLILFRSVINKFLDMNRYIIKNSSIIINEKNTFNINGNLIEVSTDDKIKIISFLKENCIPVSNQTFREGFIKQYKNELYGEKCR